MEKSSWMLVFFNRMEFEPAILKHKINGLGVEKVRCQSRSPPVSTPSK